MKVLVVDDHPLIRTGVRGMLARHDQACDVAEAEDCNSALALLAEGGNAPDLILLDLNLPDCSGLAALEAVREACPDAPVVVLSGNDDKATILDALNLGAMGFIPKSMNPELVWSALGLVLAGGVYVPPQVVTDRGNAPPHRIGQSSGKTSALASLGLTERQIDTLRMLVKGLPNKTIARNLGISEATVKVYVSAALRAMNVTSRTQAVIWLSQNGVGFEDKREAV
ncbi:MAG: response regulator transcription factor [Zoogloeaceae bacterium]|nr:response regulator transcription factor [Zoogloeaceae bacterium]MCK6385722.1 response regulator transcription factor [Rhodocyclaceae bacterium]